MVFNSPCLTDKKELIHHEVEMVINSPWIMPLLGTKGLASPEQTATVGLFNKATKTANYMVLEGVLMKNKDAASSRDIQLICAEFSSIQVKTQADWMLLQSSYFNPQVPTGRVVVPTGRYVVPAGKVIIIVSPGRLSLVPIGRVLSPGSKDLSRVGTNSTFMGCCLTSWFSKKKTALSISTTEAEYVSARKACQQALWINQALIDYGVRLDDIPIMCDNKGAIDLSKNLVQHSRTKHIEICHHFLRDNV
ncbi:hypothetical protein Tco_1347476 [Tanacetum coccineum]